MHPSSQTPDQVVANTQLPPAPAVRELASGVDALYLSGHGYLPKAFLARLEDSRQFADQVSLPVPFELGPLTFGLAPHGWGKYRFCLDHEDLHDPRALITMPDVALRLGTSVRHVRRLVAERRIPIVKVGRFVRFEGHAIEHWIDDHRVARRHVAPTSFATESDARAFLASVETDIRRGGWIDPWAGGMSVRELAGEWTASDPTKRESTTAREELTLRLHVFPVLGEHRIERVGPQDVQRLVNDWSTTYAPRTVKRNYEVVRAMFGYAVRNDWLARNPCRNVKLPVPDGTRRHDLTPEDVDGIASHVAPWYRPMVWIGATLGLRWSEVAGLRVGRLDLAGGKLSVVEAVVRGIGGRNVFGPPKSRAGKRTMFMPAAIVTMLSAHLEQAGFTPGDSDTLVFTDESGGPLRYSNWRRRVWLPAAEAAGCEGAGFHDLRRLNATTLVVEGIDVKTAQVRLGHADPRMTLAIYASAPASVDRAAADVIGERFFGQNGQKTPARSKAENLRAISAPSALEEPGASDS